MNLEALGRIPPQNIEAEQSVLGSILLDPEVIIDAITMLKSEDFYNPQHQAIFDVVHGLHNNNKPIDIITVSEQLQIQNIMDDIGGFTYLSHMINIVPTTSNIKHYIKIVEEKSIRRQLIKQSSYIQEKAYEQEYDNSIDLKNDALEIISKIDTNDKNKNRSIKKTSEELDFDINRKRNQDNNSEEKYYTGLIDYDYWLDGLHEQELTIIGARPGQGKTIAGLQIAKYLAKKGLHIPFFTLEMSDKQLLSRLISSESKINSHKLRKPKLMTDEEYKLYKTTLAYINELPLYIEESKYIQEIRSYCRQMKMKNKLDALFVDYIQLMLTMKKTNNRNEELGDISRGLKSISKEFNIPVVALAQLNRTTEKENREPRLSDLRECGDMEQDADNVIFIHEEDETDSLVEIRKRKIIIAKQRNGSTGYFYLNMEGKTFNFYNIKKEDKSVPIYLKNGGK